MLKTSLFGADTALYMALLLVFMIMAAQFESLRFSALSCCRCLWPSQAAFWRCSYRNHLNLASLMGVVMLVGVVVNNAIVLIDRAG